MKNKELLNEFIELVWSQGDLSCINRFVAEQYTIHHDPGDPWHQKTLDRTQFIDRVKKSRFAFPDQKFFIEEMVAENDRVVATWLWSGTHKEQLMDFMPTNKMIEMSGITLYFLDNGLLKGHWQLVDRLGVYQQLMQNQASPGVSQ